MSQYETLKHALDILASWTGARIRALRKRDRMTGAELGICLGKMPYSARSIVHQLESEQRRPSLAEAVELARLEEGKGVSDETLCNNGNGERARKGLAKHRGGKLT